MYCVEGLVLVVCERECFCMMHACGDGVFKVCELQGGEESGFFRGGDEAKLGLGSISVYVVHGRVGVNSMVLVWNG